KNPESSNEFLGTDADDPAAPDILKPIKPGRVLQRNFIAVLTALSNTTAFAFVPELMTTDVPTQFLELLRVVQKYLKKGDFRLDTAL
ncbi:unnamed protein product, partial [Allacma fusca]